MAWRTRTWWWLGALLVWVLAASPAPAAEPSRIRVLSMADPFALVIADQRGAFEAIVGAPLSIELSGYTELRRRILLNAFADVSKFDLVAIDMSWGREMLSAGLLRPLDDLLAAASVDLSSYLPTARAGATIDGVIIGLPAQPHAELLFHHRAVFEKARLAPPKTTAELLATAQKLHNPASGGQAGVCWNARRGAPLGQTMLHFLAAFGGSALDTSGRASLDTPEMIAAIRYARALTKLSPPDILSMAWDERIEAFAAGRCAMSYGWTGRTMLLQRLGIDVASGVVGVSAAPHAPGRAAVSPLGAWLLAVPANLPKDRLPIALQALLKLTSEEANRLYLKGGVGALLHVSLLDDADLRGRNPAFKMLGELERGGQLMTSMRPNIPQFQALTEILGTEVFAVLLGQKDAPTAARAAQAAFQRLLGE